MENKANKLRDLKSFLNYPVPTFVTTDELHLRDVSIEVIWKTVKQYFYVSNDYIFDHNPMISIRSSGTYSMPGILKTKLDIDLSQFHEFKLAYELVLESYNSKLAQAYRKRFNLPEELYPTIIFQKMVYGEKGCSGIHYTADPRKGILTPVTVYSKGSGESIVNGGKTTTTSLLPELVYRDLERIGKELELHYMYPQDIEFTYDGEQLWILQTRELIFNTDVVYKIHSEMNLMSEYNKNLIIEKTPELLIEKEYYIDQEECIVKGESVTSGIGKGILTTSSSDQDYIYFTDQLMLDENMDFTRCKGIITSIGNELCHAAIVTRKLNIPCIIDIQKDSIKDLFNKEIIMDGKSGRVYFEIGVDSIKPSNNLKYYNLIKEQHG